MAQTIIAISGKAQSGKDATANYLAARINAQHQGKNNTTEKICKIYSFADKLKRDVCINLLGLAEKMCYGNDEEKNQLTNLRWQEMPGIQPELISFMSANDEEMRMTGREVMQYVGTEIFRKIHNNVWAEALIRQIQEENYPIAIIADLRFMNEAMSIKNIGGYLWRFTRNTLNMTHESETGMDGYGDWDFYLDNSRMSLESQLKWCWDEYCQVSPYEVSPYES